MRRTKIITCKYNKPKTFSIISLNVALEGSQRTIPYSSMRQTMAQYSALSGATR